MIKGYYGKGLINIKKNVKQNISDGVFNSIQESLTFAYEIYLMN